MSEITLTYIAAVSSVIVTIGGAAVFILNGLKKLIKQEMVKIEGWTKRQQEDIEQIKLLTKNNIKVVRAFIKDKNEGNTGGETFKALEDMEDLLLNLSVQGKSSL